MLDRALIDSLFPADLPEPAHWEERYPARSLPDGARVTRFAPSPTGFVHIGGIYTAVIFAAIRLPRWPAVGVAVLAVGASVLTYELAPIEAYFHASCGGRTESGQDALGRELPYLRPVDCPCGRLPASRWSATVSDSELHSALGQATEGFRVSSRTATHRVNRVATSGGASLDGVTLRRKLGYTKIKSLEFDVERTSGGWHFNGRGYGHGAGLCQWGAKALADEGLTYRDILLHYYPGTELQQLY